MQQRTRLKEGEARNDLGLAPVVDAELFRLDAVTRWLDVADTRLKRAAAAGFTVGSRFRTIDVPAIARHGREESDMGVPALLRLSDSGVRLDSGLRTVLEGAFCVDLSGVRMHAGPRTDAFLRVHGCPAAAAGHRVFMPAARRGAGERWLRVLIHEITHVIQQAQGVAQAGGHWERQAREAAEAVTAGRVYPDLGLEPPRTRHGAVVLAGFNS